jgi:conjugative relaxase-like TrwC/TraI family protein
MITIRRLSLGHGYTYLVSSIAQGDGGRRDLASPLTRYYEATGTPPGRWRGAGLDHFGEPLTDGAEVTKEHLFRMMVEGTDPSTGLPLGATTVRTTPNGGPVGAFDLTFTVPKSTSTFFALGDQGTQAVVYQCHQDAVSQVLAYAEGHVFRSRSGKNGVLQESVEGVAVASFTHWDTRAGDPNMHDHAVVMNRAKSIRDGKWRTLDSRAVFKATVALSEMYDGLVQDLLTDALGVGWEQGLTTHGVVKHDIAGMPKELLREFSRRNAAISEWRAKLVAEFRAAHGRAPSAVEEMRLNQQANLATRQAKQHRSLAEMTADWQDRAAPYIGSDPASFVASLARRNDLPALRGDDLSDEMLADVARISLDRTAERRATFTRWNVAAEVARELQYVRFAPGEHRFEVIERTVNIALGSSLQVTPPELLHVPERYRRADGTSLLRPADHYLYTTEALLDAEQRLLDAGRRTGGPHVAVAAVAEATLPGKDYTMGVDQAVAVEKIATSGRPLDVLVGPAGTGKSTTMAGLRAAWEAEHGAGSVVGLAPSAAAAEVLGNELGIPTENTVKWLHEHRQGDTRRRELAEVEALLDDHPAHLPLPPSMLDWARRLRESIDRWEFEPEQLVIVDEASLAGTFALDDLLDAAGQAGAKVLLVGDPHQLSAVDAGGMFRSLVRDRTDIAAELSEVRRFTKGWEKVASVELRVGSQAAIDAYEAHDRIEEGPRDHVLDSLYSRWKADVGQAKTSLMIAGDGATVAALNRRARAERIAAGQVAAQGLKLKEGVAGVGDEIVTRHNDRRLVTPGGFVKNGDVWVVTSTNEDGSMTVRQARRSGEVVLPAGYVAEHVELAYATTAHRAQGRTVDTAHALVSPTTQREVLYVSVTRGREANRLYVDTHYDPDPDTSHGGMTEPQTARQVLAAVLRNEGAERSATDAVRAAWDTAGSLPTLAAEYQTIAKEAQQERWDTLVESSGLSPGQLAGARGSEAYGPLMAAFRDAEARGLDPEAMFSRLVTACPLADADDVASVLHGRVSRWVEQAGAKRHAATDLIAGLIPRAKGVTDPDLQTALRERDDAIEQRALTLVEQAMERQAGWLRRLGKPPAEPAARAAWMLDARTVAAYRDRWNIGGQTVVDGPDDAGSVEQLGHQKRAQAAALRAVAISKHAHEPPAAQTTGPELAAVTTDRKAGPQL